MSLKNCLPYKKHWRTTIFKGPFSSYFFVLKLKMNEYEKNLNNFITFVIYSKLKFFQFNMLFN